MNDVGEATSPQIQPPRVDLHLLDNNGTGTGGTSQGVETVPNQDVSGVNQSGGNETGSIAARDAGPQRSPDVFREQDGTGRGQGPNNRSVGEYLGLSPSDPQTAGSDQMQIVVEQRVEPIDPTHSLLTQEGVAYSAGTYVDENGYAVEPSSDNFAAQGGGSSYSNVAETWASLLGGSGQGTTDTGTTTYDARASAASGQPGDNFSLAVTVDGRPVSAELILPGSGGSTGSREGTRDGERPTGGDGPNPFAGRQSGEQSTHDRPLATNAVFYRPSDAPRQPEVVIDMSAASTSSGRPSDAAAVANFVNGAEQLATRQAAQQGEGQGGVGGQGDPKAVDPRDQRPVAERIQEIHALLGDANAIKAATAEWNNNLQPGEQPITEQAFRQGLVQDLADLTGQTTDQVEAAIRGAQNGTPADAQKAADLNDLLLKKLGILADNMRPEDVRDALTSGNPEKLERLVNSLEKAFKARFLKMLIKRLAIAEGIAGTVGGILSGAQRAAGH